MWLQYIPFVSEQVETIKAERDTIECELKSATVDMKSKFLNALAQDGAISEHAMSVESLGVVYGPLQRQVKESLQKQEALVADIQVSYRSTAIAPLHFTHCNFSVLNLGIYEVHVMHCGLNSSHVKGS